MYYNHTVIGVCFILYLLFFIFIFAIMNESNEATLVSNWTISLLLLY